MPTRTWFHWSLFLAVHDGWAKFWEAMDSYEVRNRGRAPRPDCN
jgi:hypothetical protein